MFEKRLIERADRSVLPTIVVGTTDKVARYVPTRSRGTYLRGRAVRTCEVAQYVPTHLVSTYCVTSQVLPKALVSTYCATPQVRPMALTGTTDDAQSCKIHRHNRHCER
jgi:hypothetical protein